MNALEVVLTATHDGKPLAIVKNLPGLDAEMRPERLREDEPPSPALALPGHWQARLSDRSGVAVVIGFDPSGDPIVLDVITVMRNH